MKEPEGRPCTARDPEARPRRGRGRRFGPVAAVGAGARGFRYLTLGGGKLFHPAVPGRANIGMPWMDWPQSWSPEEPYFFPDDNAHGTPAAVRALAGGSRAPFLRLSWDASLRPFAEIRARQWRRGAARRMLHDMVPKAKDQLATGAFVFVRTTWFVQAATARTRGHSRGRRAARRPSPVRARRAFFAALFFAMLER